MTRPEPALTPADAGPCPVEQIEGDPALGVLLLCDHASNEIPPEYGDLGLPAAQLQRHIAYDIGAAALTRTLAAALGAPALLTRFSRLLIDPNRGRDDPTLVMRLSDGAVVPGNAAIGAEEIGRRISRFYDPYDHAIRDLLARFASQGVTPAIVSVHSFTPVMKGIARPWHVGVLWDADPRLARPLLTALEGEPGLVVGDNEPYDGALMGDTIDRHATVAGLANALIEVRQDLIAREEDAQAWGFRLARLLQPLVADPTSRMVKHFPSRTGLVRRWSGSAKGRDDGDDRSQDHDGARGGRVSAAGRASA